jgi:uncharacterized protein YegL/DNA-directed RNA polymerase subunit RPC12/RpoP
MAGKTLDAIENGYYTLVSALQKNPYALETVYLSVITFDAKAKVAVELCDLPSAKLPRLSVHPGTCLGAALDLLRQSIEKEVVKTTKDTKGDWRPLIFILTDGQPTDDWQGPLKRLKAVKPSIGYIYAIGCGDDVDFTILREIADVCLHNKELSTQALAKLFVWLSASVNTLSQSPEGVVSLEKSLPLNQGLVLIDKDRPPKFSEIRQRVFLHFTCRKQCQPYLVVYRYNQDLNYYMCQETISLSDDFFSSGTMKAPAIDANSLQGEVECPYCHDTAWGKCGFCGNLFCLSENQSESTITCPMCKTKLGLSFSEPSFDVEPSQG